MKKPKVPAPQNSSPAQASMTEHEAMLRVAKVAQMVKDGKIVRKVP